MVGNLVVAKIVTQVTSRGDIMLKRIELWKDWNKHCVNHPVYKFLVLIGLAHSPSFDMHLTVKEQLDKFYGYKYTIRDEKSKKKEININWGWYTVYLLMIAANSVMTTLHGFGVFTWQHWAYFWMLVLCFIAGSEYRKK